MTFEFFQGVFENRIYAPLLLRAYRLSIPFKVRKIRQKKHIRVLFMLTELSTWKTEELYLAMLRHPRFEPILGVSTSPYVPLGIHQLIDYLTEKEYDYINLDDYTTWNIGKIAPDIIFYCKPYSAEYRYALTYTRHLNALFCHVTYSTHTLIDPCFLSNVFWRFCWQQYFENRSVRDELCSLAKRQKKSMLATGYPIFDSLLRPKERLADPWRWKDRRKRIIYAPHHSIGNLYSANLSYSTFLEYGERMLELAEKYKNEAVFCFKPHPSLFSKLEIVWGRERTTSYYTQWQTLENCMMADGNYVELFLYSNAMIHDCSSFTVEYHFSHNPVLYLERCENHTDNMTSYARRAYQLHYKGHSTNDIETFIQNVIAGVDPMQAERDAFFKECLLPPEGKTGSQNIINAILGGENKYQ